MPFPLDAFSTDFRYISLLLIASLVKRYACFLDVIHCVLRAVLSKYWLSLDVPFLMGLPGCFSEGKILSDSRNMSIPYYCFSSMYALDVSRWQPQNYLWCGQQADACWSLLSSPSCCLSIDDFLYTFPFIWAFLLLSGHIINRFIGSAFILFLFCMYFLMYSGDDDFQCNTKLPLIRCGVASSLSYTCYEVVVCKISLSIFDLFYFQAFQRGTRWFLSYILSSGVQCSVRYCR